MTFFVKNKSLFFASLSTISFCPWAPAPEFSNLQMLSAILSSINSLIYTLLAFLVPLYFSIKALLRQYTVSIVPHSLPAAATTFDDSEVPSTFINAASTDSEAKTAATTTNPASSSNSAWLHYWAILAVVHCFTGVYERIVLPLVGNAFIYHCAKYAGIYWLSKDDAIAARTLWNGIIGPFVSKYENDADLLIQNCKQKGRAALAHSIQVARNFASKNAQKNIKTE